MSKKEGNKGQGHRVVVDAANVAFANHDEPNAIGSLDQILSMHKRLVALGYDPIFIADSTLKYKIDKPDELDRLEQSGKILQAPAGTEADYFLLAYAERTKTPIISNDMFRDREAEFPMVTERRVPFMFIRGEVIIDQEQLRGRKHGKES